MAADVEDTDYIELLNASFKEFTVSLREAVRISDARENIHHTGRQRRVLSVFGKTILHSMTLESITENAVRSGTGLLDHFTAGTIARSIIDASLMTMYLSEPSLSYSAWQLRREVLHLHELTNRKRFLEPSAKAAGADNPKAPFFDTYEKEKQASRSRIVGYCQALGIDPERTTKLQEGQWVYTDGGRGAAREAGWDLTIHEFEQSYFSAYVHSHPVSFMKMDEQEISWTHPSPFQRNFVSLALSSASTYLDRSNARVEMFTGEESRDPLAIHFREA
ncbi:Hypothetical protein NGAL_HAMBI1145_06490 [Neorhizobium galegae bv. officinalis]|uniref:Uncharacterized protein n=1 Tax=Neorhizobium galegae bv. officinalis TaxID=323656 RepID=A0A0T7FAB2_NEOGA|nr:hypothetical protein [Neorhizobium galegae]CDZ31881.1 Hypothetical protein NGAL_HAMBI1145_06490 [Neorhizobium galegae bv. officinalis]